MKFSIVKNYKIFFAITITFLIIGFGSMLIKGFNLGIDFTGGSIMDYLMTIGGLLVVLFVGWKMKKTDVRDEFTNGGSIRTNSRMFGPVYAIIRYVAPIAVLTIFISNLFS